MVFPCWNLEFKAIVIGGNGDSIIHAVQPVAGQRISQIAYQPIGGRRGLAITLQAFDVTVLVITRHILTETIRVCVDGVPSA